MPLVTIDEFESGDWAIGGKPLAQLGLQEALSPHLPALRSEY